MNNKELSKYRTKAKDSFKTKKNLFLFSLVLNSTNTFSLKDFKDFKIKEDLVKRYTTEYWQQEEDYEINDIPIKAIYAKIKELEHNHSVLLSQCESNYVSNFDSVFNEQDFLDLINNKTCHYCNITTDQIDKLGGAFKLYKKNLRGWNLEIDRLDSNYEYTKDNCVMACYWCYNAKTDEFTESEFIKVGEAIKQIWQDRLNDI